MPGRSRLKAMLAEKAGLGGRLFCRPTIENYPGFAGGWGLLNLSRQCASRLEEFEVEIRYEEVNKNNRRKHNI